MNLLNNILSFVIVLGVIVIVHELGHYIAARLMGVRVEVFSFGFGLRLFGKKIGETDFRFSLIPLGGYVKMAGEEEYDPKDLKPYEFQAKNRGQKIFILAAGAAMNVLLAFIIFTVINITGVKVSAYKFEPPIIGYVEKGSPAAEAGIQKGDIIRTIEGQVIKDWKELEVTIGSNPNRELPVEFERDGILMKASLKVGSISRYYIGDAGVDWDYKTKIGSLVEDSPASKAGLKEGDLIIAIDGNPVCYHEIFDSISQNAENPVQLTIKRGQEQFNIEIVPRKVFYWQSVLTANDIEEANKLLESIKKQVPATTFNIYKHDGRYKVRSDTMDTAPDPDLYPGVLTIGDKGQIGAGFFAYSPTITTHYGLFAAMGKSVTDMLDMINRVFEAVRKMIVGKLSPRGLSGPMDIAEFSGEALASGAYNFFLLIAFISLQLGIINLLPIPALDGGHLMIYSIETIIRRDFSQKIKNLLMNMGFILLIALMVFVILNDIAKRLPNGWKSILPFL